MELPNIKPTLLFYTYADCAYDFFAIPYAYFALYHNRNAKVEICLENEKRFREKNEKAINLLNNLFPSQILFREAQVIHKIKMRPNSVRFVEKPFWGADYIYIGDIDLLIMEDVLDIHLKLIKEHNLPFSNVLRRKSDVIGKPQLSGLHFCSYNNYYPLPDISDLDLESEGDEYVLYEIMSRKGLMVPSDFRYRPECGIHLSLSRDPLGRTSGASKENFSSRKGLPWSGVEEYKAQLQTMREEFDFIQLRICFDLEFQIILLILECVVFEKYRLLHRMATAYMLDKRLLISSDQEIRQLKMKRRAYIKNNNYPEADEINNKAGLLWPNNITVWKMKAEDFFRDGKYELGCEALLHIIELPAGKDYLREINIINENIEQIKQCGSSGAILLESLEGY